MCVRKQERGEGEEIEKRDNDVRVGEGKEEV